MQPSSKCALSKACCWSWGGPKEGLVPLSCRRRPPSSSPHLSFPQSCTANAPGHPPTLPGSRLGLQTQDDGSRPPCVAGLVRDLGSHQGPALRADRATRLSALRTLSVSSRSLVRSSPVAIRPDQTSAAQYVYGNAQDPLLNSGSTLSQSREFRTLRPITICFPAAMSSLQFGIRLSTSPGAQTDIFICTCSTCPRHLSILSYSIRNRIQAKAVGQLTQSVQSVSLHFYRPDRSPKPHYCSRWFGMSDENRLVLDSVAQIPKEPGVKRHPPSHLSPNQSQQDRNLAVQQLRRPPAPHVHDAYTRYWLDTARR